MNKNYIASIIVLAIAVFIIIQFGFRKGSDVIKIGYFGPFTGAAAGTTGEGVGNGFKLAESLRHDIDGHEVQVIYEDDACDPAKAVSAANKLIDVDHVNILVSGVCSGSTLSVAPIAESKKVILFTPVSESPKITTAGDYVFRTSASSVISGHAMNQGLAKLGFSKIAVLFENAEYPVGMKDAFLSEFMQKSGNEVLHTESFGSKDTDVRTQLANIARLKPQIIAVFINSSITANIVADQARDLKINAPIIGNAYYAFKQSLTDSNNEGGYVAVYKFDSNAPAFTNMLASYKQMFGTSPSQDIYAGLAYDGYNVIFNAIEACKSDNSECVKDALYATKGYQGVTGTITIDQNGDTQREFTLKKIHDGQVVDVE